MDKLFLQGLSVSAVIGVDESERQAAQMLQIDCEFCVDVRIAAQNDDVGDALDYAQLADSITSWVQATEFHLLETLIERLAEHVMAAHDVAWLQLKITKHPMGMSDIKGVSLMIERRRD